MERVRPNKPTKAAPANLPIPQLEVPQQMRVLMREKRFAMLYIKHGANATKALMEMGMQEKSARSEGARYLAKPSVRAMVQHYQEQLQDRTQVTIEKLLAELGKVAFASMQDYYAVDENGNSYLDLNSLTPAMWAAIGEITTETYFDGPKGREREVKRTKFKLHDKLAAIDKAMRHLGGYPNGRGGADSGDGESVTVNNTTVYTLNIGNANVVVSKNVPAIEGKHAGASES